MADEIVIDGFRFSHWPAGKQLLIVESDRLAACVAYCNERRIQRLHISPYHGYYLENLDFLQDCPQVTGIHLQRGFNDMREIYAMPHLASVSAIFENDLDFSKIPSLTDVATDWSKRIDDGLMGSRSLTRLWLRGYKPKERDLTRLAVLQELQDLSIIQARIETVQGIERLLKLRNVTLAHCRNLRDIQPILKLADSLEELELDHCRKIIDLQLVRRLHHLRLLRLSNCGSLPSLCFVRTMSGLEFISFVGTTILDGDMSPCFGLRYAGFLNKRSYSHTFEEVRQIIKSRVGSRSLYPAD